MRFDPISKTRYRTDQTKSPSYDHVVSHMGVNYLTLLDYRANHCEFFKRIGVQRLSVWMTFRP